MRPADMSLLSRRGVSHIGVGPSGTARDEETNLDLVKESLMQLTMSVPYTKDEDILVRMRCHTSGGGSRFTRLFRKITRVVVFYSENHPDE